MFSARLLFLNGGRGTRRGFCFFVFYRFGSGHNFFPLVVLGPTGKAGGRMGKAGGGGRGGNPRFSPPASHPPGLFFTGGHGGGGAHLNFFFAQVFVLYPGGSHTFFFFSGGPGAPQQRAPFPQKKTGVFFKRARGKKQFFFLPSFIFFPFFCPFLTCVFVVCLFYFFWKRRFGFFFLGFFFFFVFLGALIFLTGFEGPRIWFLWGRGERGGGGGTEFFFFFRGAPPQRFVGREGGFIWRGTPAGEGKCTRPKLFSAFLAGAKTGGCFVFCGTTFFSGKKNPPVSTPPAPVCVLLRRKNNPGPHGGGQASPAPRARGPGPNPGCGPLFVFFFFFWG